MHVLQVIALLCILSSGESLFWGVQWLWKTDDQLQNRRAIGAIIDNVPVPNVQYEAKTDDDKFLEAAKKYTDLQLSDLDTCQHKIVMQIRGSCSQMTEEELAKISVNLLNCQSAVEGRKQYPCSEKMSLKECTGDMDPDTWNAYHLMSNRARAVCYAARQQQFRALSEMTVNKLMSTAHDQLATMEKLKDGQLKLESFTVGTLQAVAEGQGSLLEQQERMRVTQQGLRDFVGQNLRELTREKALIAAGHKELSKLTEDIKAKLDAASSQLIQHTVEQSGNHQQIAKDLEFIKEHAKVIWDEIESSTQQILAQHEAATVKYEDTLDKLAKINATVTFLLHLMEKTHNELNERLGWLSHVIGAAGIYTFCMHIAYLLVGMIATAFVQAPAVTRLCLLLIVPLNLAVIYHHGYESALDYISMTTIIIVSTAVHWFITSLLIYSKKQKHPPMGMPQNHNMKNGNAYSVVSESDMMSPITSRLHTLQAAVSRLIGRGKLWVNHQSSLMEKKKREMNSNNSSGSDEESDAESEMSIPPLPQKKIVSEWPRTGNENFSIYRRTTPLPSFRSPPTPPRSSSRSGTPLHSPSIRPGTPKLICVASCRNGTPCRNNALAGHSMCRVHQQE